MAAPAGTPMQGPGPRRAGAPFAPAQAPRRILVVRLSALGDVVITSGLIPGLRALWPQAEISWLVESRAAPLLQHNTRLDHLLVWPRDRWKSLWRQRQWRTLAREVLAFRRDLRARRFDLVIDAQGLLKSAVCAWFTGAPQRIGVQPREGSGLFMHQTLKLAPPQAADAPPIAFEYRQLLSMLGADGRGFRLDLAIGEDAARAARDALSAQGVGSRYAVLAAFTTRPQKHWFEERWADLAARLQAQGLQPVLLGGPGDEAAAARICAAAPSIANLVGRLKLDQTAAAIGGAALLVGVDTGLTHMGIALEIPTLALFGSTMPYTRADSPSVRVLYEQLPCSPCGRHPTCGGRFDCMRQYEADAVAAAALALLA